MPKYTLPDSHWFEPLNPWDRRGHDLRALRSLLADLKAPQARLGIDAARSRRLEHYAPCLERYLNNAYSKSGRPATSERDYHIASVVLMLRLSGERYAYKVTEKRLASWGVRGVKAPRVAQIFRARVREVIEDIERRLESILDWRGDEIPSGKTFEESAIELLLQDDESALGTWADFFRREPTTKKSLASRIRK